MSIPSFSNYVHTDTQTPTQTPVDWNDTYDINKINEASNKDIPNEDNNDFSETELDSFLQSMGITDTDELEILKEHLLAGNNHITASALLAFFDREDSTGKSDGEIKKDEVKIISDVVKSLAEDNNDLDTDVDKLGELMDDGSAVDVLADFFTADGDMLQVYDDKVRSYIADYESMSGTEESNATIILQYMIQLIVEQGGASLAIVGDIQTALGNDKVNITAIQSESPASNVGTDGAGVSIEATDVTATDSPVTDVTATDSPVTDVTATDSPVTKSTATDSPVTKSTANDSSANDSSAKGATKSFGNGVNFKLEFNNANMTETAKKDLIQKLTSAEIDLLIKDTSGDKISIDVIAPLLSNDQIGKFLADKTIEDKKAFTEALTQEQIQSFIEGTGTDATNQTEMQKKIVLLMKGYGFTEDSTFIPEGMTLEKAAESMANSYVNNSKRQLHLLDMLQAGDHLQSHIELLLTSQSTVSNLAASYNKNQNSFDIQAIDGYLDVDEGPELNKRIEDILRQLGVSDANTIASYVTAFENMNKDDIIATMSQNSGQVTLDSMEDSVQSSDVAKPYSTGNITNQVSLEEFLKDNKFTSQPNPFSLVNLLNGIGYKQGGDKITINSDIIKTFSKMSVDDVADILMGSETTFNDTNVLANVKTEAAKP